MGRFKIKQDNGNFKKVAWKDEVDSVAGEGRTTETVKGNADKIGVLTEKVNPVTPLNTTSQDLSGAVNEINDKVDTNKQEIDQNKQETQLKVLNVEKELNDYKKTLAQVNVNHEAKQSASGYGTISLPPNAANGQVSASVKGMTLKNELNYNRDTWAEWANKTNVVGDSTGLEFTMVDGAYAITYLPTNLKPTTKYGILVNIVKNELTTKTINIDATVFPSGAVIAPSGITGNRKIIATTKDTISSNRLYLQSQNTAVDAGKKVKIIDIRCFELPAGSEIEQDFETMTADELAQKYPYIQGGTPKSTISAMRITAENEDKTEKSQAYVVAKKDNKIVNLRSLPNGVRDEIKDGVLVKRNEMVEINDDMFEAFEAGVNINMVRIFKPHTSIGHNNIKNSWAIIEGYTEEPIGMLGDVVGNDSKFCLNNFLDTIRVGLPLAIDTMEKAKDYLRGRVLIYQLAEPEIIPIEVSGSLVSYPNGTVYFEKAQPDANVYNNGISIQEQELNIDYIDKLSKVDYETGIETELDASKAVIAEDKKSFTHPDLVNGDMVFFSYFYSNESTEGEATVEYYDSRYVIPDKTLPDKFYKWDVEVDNGVPSVTVTEV